MRDMKDSGIEWIGKIPKEWGLSKIKYCSDFSPKCNITKLLRDSFVTYTPMEYIKSGYYIPNFKEYGELPNSLTSYEEGDIVFAKVN